MDANEIFVERLGQHYRLSWGTKFMIVADLNARVATATLNRGWVDGPCGRTTGADYEATLRLFGVTEEEAQRLRRWLPTALNRSGIYYQYLRLSEARRRMSQTE